MKIWAKSRARPAPQREGFRRRFGFVGLVRVEGHLLVQRAHQPVHGVERILGARLRLGRERAQGAVDMGERAIAQVHLRRQPLDRTPHDPGAVAGLDFAVRRHRQALDRRPVMRERAHHIAVGVLGLFQHAVHVEGDPPTQNVLTVEAIRRQPQVLDSILAGGA